MQTVILVTRSEVAQRPLIGGQFPQGFGNEGNTPGDGLQMRLKIVIG